MNIVLAVLVFILLVLFIPMSTLWGLNTLSEQALWGWYIPHNFWTYVAVIALCLPISSSQGVNK